MQSQPCEPLTGSGTPLVHPGPPITYPNRASLSCGLFFVYTYQCGVAPSYVLDVTAGVFLRQHDVKAGDCIAIKRMWDDSLRILINPEDLAEGRQVRCSPAYALLLFPKRFQHMQQSFLQMVHEICSICTLCLVCSLGTRGAPASGGWHSSRSLPLIITHLHRITSSTYAGAVSYRANPASQKASCISVLSPLSPHWHDSSVGKHGTQASPAKVELH